MAGACITRLYHRHPSCMSEHKSLQVFKNDDGTFSGYCFSCGKYVSNPLGEISEEDAEKIRNVVPKTPEQIAQEIAEIKECKYLDHKYRDMDAEDWKYYGVRLGVSTYDGVTPAFVCFPRTKDGKIVSFKVKCYNKKIMWSVGENEDIDLYGWARASKAGSKALYITEGEEDCQALRKMLKQMNRGTEYESLDYAVVSLNNGASSAVKEIARQLKDINALFKEVVLVFDQDRPGQDAAREVVSKLLPDAKIAKLPCKDANACLHEGRIKATRDAVVFNMQKSMPSTIRSMDSLLEEALEEVQYGISTPWSELDKLTYGIRKKEVWGIGGGTGTGKTTIAHELMAHVGKAHGWRSLGILMEETGADSLRNLAGKVDCIPYNTPGMKYDKEKFKNTVMDLSKHVVLWNHDEISDPHSTWNGIKQTIRTYGAEVDMVMIDNMTALSEGLSMSDKNDFIGLVAKECVDLATKFDICIIIFSHLNAPDKNSRSHENGGKVHESQFTGSRALQRYCHMMFGFERNKQAIDPNCSIIRLLKNRKYGKTGHIKTYYDPETSRLTQRNWEDDLYKDA